MAEEIFSVSPFTSIFEVPPGKKIVVTGAGAAARGAFEAGVGFVSTYPGSPVTETFELLASLKSPASPICHLSMNEHVAFHKALGFSLAGGRSFVTMKHVGFNVASDPAHYAGYTGAKGGMVIFVGTDPGAFCSTGEFDFRFYSLHTHLPLLEPVSVQEIFRVVRDAFDWSERDRLPYVVAVPAGACYSLEGITAGTAHSIQMGTSFKHDPDLTNVGSRTVKNHQKLLKRLTEVVKEAKSRDLIKSWGSGNDTLIVTSGVHFNRVIEAVQLLNLVDRVTVFCSTLTYPFPVLKLKPFLEKTSRILFVEDLGGFIETSISSYLVSLRGQWEMSGKNLFPAYGSLDLRIISDTLIKVFELAPQKHVNKTQLPDREGTFCPGCAYRPFFYVLTDFLKEDGILGGDIGCSSLPPHFSSWLTCMNSGTSIAAGVSLALEGRQQVVSLIGDSTLFHSGLQTILESASTNSDQICFVLYNHWTAMTGHQDTPVSPHTATGETKPHLDIEQVLRALGVREIQKIDPYRLNNFRALLKRILPQKGFRVVLVERECSLQARRRPKRSGWQSAFFLQPERCQECKLCYERLCCPAIVKDPIGVYSIDSTLCAQCGVCAQVCPNSAILSVQRKLR